MAPEFGKVYDRADFTKMFPMVHGTEKKIVWSCTPPVQLSRGLQSFENHLRTAKKRLMCMYHDLVYCGILVLSARLSCIAIHSRHMCKKEIMTLTMDNC